MANRRNTERPLCKCGCSSFVEWDDNHSNWLKYIKGHYGAGVTFPPIGSVPSKCLCGCGFDVKWDSHKHRWNTYKKGHYSKSDAFRVLVSAVMSDTNTRSWRDDEYRAYHTERLRKQSQELHKPGGIIEQLWKNKEYRDMMSRLAKERWENQDYRNNMSAKAKLQWLDKDYREMHRKKASAQIKLQWQDENFRKSVSECQSRRLKALWATDEYRDYMLNTVMQYGAPNKLEALFDSLTPECVKYVGDGSFWRTWQNGKHKNPDFLVYNKNGRYEKKIIEVFGDYWHRNDDPMVDIEMWRRMGYECLVIWEHQVYEDPDAVVDMVLSFIGEEMMT